MKYVLAGCILGAVAAVFVLPAPTEAAYADAVKALTNAENNLDIREEVAAGSDKVAATRVRKAFLKAKKAFNQAYQNIESIKKGDEDPSEDVPCYFCDEEDGEGGGDGDDQVEDGPEIQK